MIGSLLLSVVVSVALPSNDGGPPAEAAEKDGGAREQLEESLTDVLASCEKALGASECTRQGTEEDTWRALVVFTDDGVKVTLSRPNRVIVRSLEFLPHDSEKQRRVAAGLLVAAMTAAARLSEPGVQVAPDSEGAKNLPPPAAPRKVEAPVPVRTVPAETPRPGAKFSLEVAALGGSTLGGPHLGAGGLVTATAQVWRHVGFGVGVDGVYSRQGGWEATKVQGGLGPRLTLFSAENIGTWRLAAEAAVDVTQIRDVRTEDSAQGAVRPGGRVRTSWAFGSRALRPILGVGVAALSSVIEIRRDGIPERVVPVVLGSVFLGVAYK